MIPDWTEYTDPALEEHKKEVNSHLQRYISELDAVKLKAGLMTAMHISSLGNSLLQHNKLGTHRVTLIPRSPAARSLY